MTRAGLCAACRFGRPLVTRRGTRYMLCRRAESDPRFPRYPRLPVEECRGFEPAGDEPRREGAGRAQAPDEPPD